MDAVRSTQPVAVEMKRSIRTLFHWQIANPISILRPGDGIWVIGGSPWVIARCDAVVYLSDTVSSPDGADQACQQQEENLNYLTWSNREKISHDVALGREVVAIFFKGRQSCDREGASNICGQLPVVKSSDRIKLWVTLIDSVSRAFPLEVVENLLKSWPVSFSF